MRILYEGSKYVIIQASDRELQSQLRRGIIIQRDGELRDAQGRRVLITKREVNIHPLSSFFPCSAGEELSPSQTTPYLKGVVNEDGLKVTVLGSVAKASDEVISNWHVMSKANHLVYGKSVTLVDVVKYHKPHIIKPWVLSLINAFKQLTGVDLTPYSYQDLAVGRPVHELVNYNPRIDLIYFAGNCINRIESDCYGFALPLIPVDKIPIGSVFEMTCTLYGFTTMGHVLDRGTVTVRYDDGYAVFKNAFMLSFDGSNGVPGCSGSRIHVLQASEEGGVSSVVYTTVSIKRIDSPNKGVGAESPQPNQL